MCLCVCVCKPWALSIVILFYCSSKSNNVSPRKRNSVDSPVTRQHSEDHSPSVSKVPLLPAVVTPQFPTMQSRNPFPSSHSLSSSRPARPYQHVPSSSTSRASNSPSKQFLPVVNEDTETSSSDKTLTDQHQVTDRDLTILYNIITDLVKKLYVW